MAMEEIIQIGVPHYGKVDVPFVGALTKLITHNLVRKFSLMFEGSCDVSYNRNNLIRHAKALGATHLLFIDSDMVFPADGLERLLAKNKDIVGASACKRGDENGILIGKPMGSGPLPLNGLIMTEYETTKGLLEMEHFGSCFMLIKTAVFEMVGMPSYFSPANYETGAVDGEDINFCNMARKLGYHVWLDIELSKEIGHVGEKIYYPKF